MAQKIYNKLENRVRGWFSHYPVLYAIVGGLGIVLFWRGVWHTVDYVMLFLQSLSPIESTIDLTRVIWWDGPLSLIVGLVILLLTGLFVSNFIGNEVIMSGLRGDKKLTEKTEYEVKTEAHAIASIRDMVQEISQKLDQPKN